MYTHAHTYTHTRKINKTPVQNLMTIKILCRQLIQIKKVYILDVCCKVINRLKACDRNTSSTINVTAVYPQRPQHPCIQRNLWWVFGSAKWLSQRRHTGCWQPPTDSCIGIQRCYHQGNHWILFSPFSLSGTQKLL